MTALALEHGAYTPEVRAEFIEGVLNSWFAENNHIDRTYGSGVVFLASSCGSRYTMEHDVFDWYSDTTIEHVVREVIDLSYDAGHRFNAAPINIYAFNLDRDDTGIETRADKYPVMFCAYDVPLTLAEFTASPFAPIARHTIRQGKEVAAIIGNNNGEIRGYLNE